MSKESKEELLKAWSDFPNEKPFIAIVDQDIIKKDELVDNKSQGSIRFDFSYLPQPWWGNIDDPKVIILAINPGIHKIPEKEKEENDSTEKLIRDNLNGTPINWLKEGSVTKDWWTQTLNDVIDELKEENKSVENIANKLGVFELFGYHSSKFNSGDYSNIAQVINKEFGSNKTRLPTQEKLFKHLNSLIDASNPPLVVIIWGQKFWKEVIDKLDNNCDKVALIDYIDTVSTRSHYLSKGNLRPIDFKRLKEALD